MSRKPEKGSAYQQIARIFLENLEGRFPVSGEPHPGTRLAPRDFAGALKIHVNHLNRALKAVTGKTTTEAINGAYLLEAKRLLAQSDWSILDISLALGFSEANHFSAFFRKHAGTSPTQFRRVSKPHP